MKAIVLGASSSRGKSKRPANEAKVPGATLLVFESQSVGLFSPVKRALLKRISISDHKDRDKAQHAPKNEAAVRDRLFVNNRPRIHEHDFEIEEDEEHGHNVELHAEPR